LIGKKLEKKIGISTPPFSLLSNAKSMTYVMYKARGILWI